MECEPMRRKVRLVSLRSIGAARAASALPMLDGRQCRDRSSLDTGWTVDTGPQGRLHLTPRLLSDYRYRAHEPSHRNTGEYDVRGLTRHDAMAFPGSTCSGSPCPAQDPERDRVRRTGGSLAATRWPMLFHRLVGRTPSAREPHGFGQPGWPVLWQAPIVGPRGAVRFDQERRSRVDGRRASRQVLHKMMLPRCPSVPNQLSTRHRRAQGGA